jgi:H+/gluconate symporter-like permease
MEIIGVIGMVVAIVALVYLTFKGMNGFVASLIATVILIVTSVLPFWDTLINTYAASLGSTFASYLFMFCIASAYSELMKQSGAAESIANFLFGIFGVKASCAATVIISFLLAYSGINAFIIIFAIYPVAVPMFRKANISKNLMPAIFLYGSVVLNVVTPGSPSMLCIALSEKLGTSTYSAPVMAAIILVLAFGIGIIYFTWSAKSLRAKGDIFVASESDAELIAGSTTGKELPPIYLSVLPYIVIIVLKLILANTMSASNSVCTSILVGSVVLAITNYKYLKGHIIKDFTAGWLSSINALLLTAALMGFAAVVKISVGFEYFMDFAMVLADKMNPYLSAVVCINVFSGVTGASLSGTQIFCSTLMDQFVALGVNTEALYKILSVASMGLDTLPHCPTFVMMATVCGVTTKASYKHVLAMTVITPIALALVGVVLATIGII